MPVPYHPLALANEFIPLAGDFGVDHMKLQKLVYCAHGWWLNSRFPSRVVNEDPQVWKHGPVFPSLYSVMAGLGGTRLNNMRALVFGEPVPRVDDADSAVCELIEFVWARYGHMTAFELSDMTHKMGTPWQLTAAQHDYMVPRNTIIPAEVIRDEFRRIAASESPIPVAG